MVPSKTQVGRAPRRSRPRLEPGRDFVPDDGYLFSLDRAFGGSRLALGIGPMEIRLEGLSHLQAEELAERFRRFVVATGPERRRPDLVVRLRQAGVERFLALPDGGSETYRMGSRDSGRLRHFWSYEFAGWVDLERQEATLALVAASGPPFDRGVENFLRVMTAAFIIDRGGLLVHGSGVVRGGKAYVFFGPSGSGKTTVSNLSPGDTVLSDDLTLIVSTPDGFRAAGIPFGMVHHRVPDTNAAFPIASLNRLVQSREVYRERIDGARAVAELGGSLPFVMQRGEEASRALETAGRVVEKIPAYRLHFRRDASFWSVVEER